MPAKTSTEDRRAYYKEWREKNKEEIRLKDKLRRIEKREVILKRKEKANRAKGHQPRLGPGDRVQMRVHVPKVRRYMIVAERVFFNSQIGFTWDELTAIRKEFEEELKLPYEEEEPAPRTRKKRA